MQAVSKNLSFFSKALSNLTVQRTEIAQKLCQFNPSSTISLRTRHFTELSIRTNSNFLENAKTCRPNRQLTHAHCSSKNSGMSKQMYLNYNITSNRVSKQPPAFKSTKPEGRLNSLQEFKSLNYSGMSKCSQTFNSTKSHPVIVNSQAFYNTISRPVIQNSKAFYSTKSNETVKEMSEDEKLLFKAIQSEKDISPVDGQVVDIHPKTDGNTGRDKLTTKKSKKKKTEKFKEKMVENLNFPNVTVYGIGRLNLTSLKTEFEKDELYVVCQLPPEFHKEVLMVRSKSKNQDDTYTEAFFFRSYGIACWAMNQHQGEKLVMKAIKSKQGTRFETMFKSFQDVIDNREVFRTVQSESVQRVKDKIHLPSVTDANLVDDKISLDLSLKKYSFSKALLQSVTLGLFEEMLDDFIENRGLKQRTEELKLGIGSAMNSKNVYTGFGEISYIRYQANLSDLFEEDPDEYWEYDDLEKLYTDMVSYLSIPNRIRELNKNCDYCQDLIKLFNDRLTDKHHVVLERIIIVLIFIEILIELVRIAVPYVVPTLFGVASVSDDSNRTSENKHR